MHSLVPSFLGCQGVEIHDPCLLSELKSMRRLVCGSEEVKHEERLFLDAGSQKYGLAKRSPHYNVGGTQRHIYLSLIFSTDNEDDSAYTILARTHSKDVGGAITSRITQRREDGAILHLHSDKLKHSDKFKHLRRN